MALKKDDRTWREQGEEYAEKASRYSPEHGTHLGLLAVYCEMRHASGDDRAAEEDAAVVRPSAGVRVGGRLVR